MQLRDKPRLSSRRVKTVIKRRPIISEVSASDSLARIPFLNASKDVRILSATCNYKFQRRKE